MRNSQFIVSAVVVLASGFGIGAGSAADLPARTYTKAPAMVANPGYDWTGFYVGASAGYNWSQGNVGSNGTVAFTDPFFGPIAPSTAAAQLAAIPAALSTQTNGFIGGVQAGYNRQWDRTVLGIEADFSGLSARGFNSSNTAVQIGVAPPGVVIASTTSVDRKLESLGTVRGRIGFTPIDRLLIFATGGFAFGQAEASTTVTQSCPVFCPIGFPNPAAGSASKVLTGWVVGGGVEYALVSNWSLKGEYLHYDLGNMTYASTLTSNFAGPLTIVNVSSTANFKGDIVRAGINYKFGVPIVARY